MIRRKIYLSNGHYNRTVGFVKAKFRILGEKASLEGMAVVNTESLVSIVDKEVADALGFRFTGRRIKLTTLSGEEVIGDEALVKVLEVEGEKLMSERVAVCELPNTVKEKLKMVSVDAHVIIGTVTLEAAGFVVNPSTGKLEKVGWLALH